MKFFRRLIPHAIVIINLVLVFPFVYGCSGDSESSNPFHKLLGLIPREVDVSRAPIYLIDYASFYKDNNISLTTADNRPVSIQEFIDLIRDKELQFAPMGLGSHITGFGKYAMTSNIKDRYVGYNFTDVDAEIQTGVPPGNIVAAIGRFNPQATRDALSYQDEWVPWMIDAYSIKEYRGVTIHSWGNGFDVHMEGPLTPPHLDQLGRAQPLAVTSDYLFSAPLGNTVELMIDAGQDRMESLADLPEFSKIADELAKHDVYSALMGIESIVNGGPEHEDTYSGPLLKKFFTFGSTAGQDEHGTYLILVLYHENSDDAKSNVSLLQERVRTTDSVMYELSWSELLTDTDIYNKGNLLVAKLYTQYTRLWDKWIYAREPLLLHES